MVEAVGLCDFSDPHGLTVTGKQVLVCGMQPAQLKKAVARDTEGGPDDVFNRTLVDARPGTQLGNGDRRGICES
jgi:hypothetical protein